MSNLDFSVVIPTYNRSKYVRFSIISALRQKNVRLEVIVIDDGSDNTEDIVKSLKDKRIRYIKNKKRLGYGLNVKKCFVNSRGKFIFTLGDDDVILDDNTLYNVKKAMNKYKVGLGKIAGYSYENDPTKPVKSYIMAEKYVVLKPEKKDEILLKTFDFNIGFYSGLVFVNKLVDKSKFIDHMGHAYFSLVFNLIKQYGFVYIPKYYILARLSYEMMPTYFNIKEHGSFFVEDLFNLLDENMTTKTAQKYKDKFIKNWISFLPHIQYFSNYRNLITVISKLMVMDNRLLFNPKFYFWSLVALTPKPMILLLRNILVQKSKKETEQIIAGYPYEQFVNAIFNKQHPASRLLTKS